MSTSKILNRYLAGCALLLIFSTTLHSQVPAFPGALGFGANATGGRGGSVYHVTTLADSGPGSFRDAVSKANRVVVFDVGGYINLASEVAIKNNITIAGQTAPGDGIGIMGAEVSCGSSTNIIIRHVRFRPGSNASSTDNGVNLYTATNVILDHISIEFAPYNNIDAVNCDNITVQNSIIADPIGQQFGAHSEHLNSSFAWCYNLWVNAHNRQPLAKINTIYINNVVYNYQAGYTCGDTSGSFSHDIINNYFITGPSTTTPSNDFFQIDAHQSTYGVGNLRDSNNDGTLGGSPTDPNEGGPVLTSPWSSLTPTIPTFSTVNGYYYDISSAGVLPRDSVDAQVVRNVKSLGTVGQMWTSQTQTGLGNNGFGTINGGIASLDSDGDGMPDYWEIAVGLNPGVNDAMIVGADGYANIEHFLNWLADPHALTVTNTPLDVDLWQYTSGFTNTSPVYAVSSGSNGVAALSGHIVHFTPDTGFSGLASFQFAVVGAYTNTVSIVVSPIVPPSNLVWQGDGVANNWSGINWFDGTNLVAFVSGDNVTFDDTGSDAPAINLAGTVAAGTVSVIAAQDYTFGGSGALTGPTSLFKTGSGQLTLNTLNTFSGGTLINDGVVQLGDGATVNGNLSGNVTNNDTLIYANPGALTSGVSISGPGILTKTGAGALTLSGTQTYSGPTTINAGSLQISGTLPPSDISNNTSLVLAPSVSQQYTNVISGPGNLSVSAGSTTLTLSAANLFTGNITNNSGFLQLANNQAAGSGTVVYNAGAVLVGNGAVITNNFSIPGSATSDLCMMCTNGVTGTWAGNIVNLGSAAQWRPGSDGGTLIFTGTANQGSHNFIVPRGSFQIASNAVVSATGSATAFGRDTSAGNRSANITIKDNAAVTLGVCSMGGNQAGGSVTLTVQNNALLSTGPNLFNLHYVARSTAVTTLRLNGGTIIVGGFSKTNTTDTNVINFNGGILKAGGANASFLPAFNLQTVNVQAGGARLDDGGFAITVAQPLTHDPALGATADGGLAKSGSGTLTLTAAATLTGPTKVTAGTLALSGAGSIANSASVYVAQGSLLDASGAAGGGLTLSSGHMLLGYGSINGNFTLGSGAVLSPGSNSIGRLTFLNSVTFNSGSSNLFGLSKSPATNDAITVGGALTLGGTLVVTNTGTNALTAGDTFKLFDAATFNGGFDVVSLPPLDTSLAWNTNSLASAGLISVVSVTRPLISIVSASGGSLVFGGTGGVANETYYVLSSTDASLPLSQWSSVVTGQFDASGNFSVTNPVLPAVPQRFYLLSVPP